MKELQINEKERLVGGSRNFGLQVEIGISNGGSPKLYQDTSTLAPNRQRLWTP